MGRLPEAWIGPAGIGELRELARGRLQLGQRRRGFKEQVHAVLAKLGIPVTCTGVFGVWGNMWRDGLALPQPSAGRVASLRKLTGELATEVALLDAVIADLLAGHDGYHAVQALPGSGPVLAAVIVAEIGGIRRFSCPAQLCSWAGMTPRHRGSGAKGRPWAHHQTGLPDPALGGGGGHPAPARWQPGPPGQRPHHRPPWQGRRKTSPTPRRPATCSPPCSARCAAGRPGPWPPAAAPRRPREQARTPAARDRPPLWPPPPGGAAAPLIDPAAGTRNAPSPAGHTRGTPKG
jgi:Transposase IS116/IS110/IS902 family